MNRLELVKLLIEERNFHFTHPHEIIRKIMFSIGATITSIFIAIFIKKEKIESAELFELLSEWYFIAPLIVILIGYLFILYGIKEHSYIHREQRKRVSQAIEYLISIDDMEFDIKKFWNEYGSIYLKVNSSKQLSNPTGLFAIEPDTRQWWKFHDRKIELGGLIIIFGFLKMIFNIVW